MLLILLDILLLDTQKPMASRTYLSLSEFNENIFEIYLRSKKIQNFSWNLIKCEQSIDQKSLQFKFSYIKVEPSSADYLNKLRKDEVFYLEKINQRLVSHNPA